MSGGSDQTTSSTSNNYDQRQVITNTSNYNDLSDHRVTNNDFSDHSTTYNDFSDHSTTVTNNDFSDRSTKVTNNDFSDHSTNLWDNSTHIDNHSVTNTTNNYLDNGAIAGGLKVASDSVAAMLQAVSQSLGLASSVTAKQAENEAHAYDYADNIFHASLDAMNDNDARAMDAFNRAAVMEKDALAMSQTAAKAALDQVQNAYADAKGTTEAQQKIMLAVLAVAAVAVMSVRMGK